MRVMVRVMGEGEGMGEGDAAFCHRLSYSSLESNHKVSPTYTTQDLDPLYGLTVICLTLFRGGT